MPDGPDILMTQDGTFRIDQTGDMDVVYGRSFALQQILIEAWEAADPLHGAPASTDDIARFQTELRRRLTNSPYVDRIRSLRVERTGETALDVRVNLNESETFSSTLRI